MLDLAVLDGEEELVDAERVAGQLVSPALDPMEGEVPTKRGRIERVRVRGRPAAGEHEVGDDHAASRRRLRSASRPRAITASGAVMAIRKRPGS